MKVTNIGKRIHKLMFLRKQGTDIGTNVEQEKGEETEEVEVEVEEVKVEILAEDVEAVEMDTSKDLS